MRILLSTVTAMLFNFASIAHAQLSENAVAITRAPAVSDFEPPPLSNYIAEFRDKRRVILEGIERMGPSTPIAERLAIYDREMGKLRDAFRNSRRAEYAGINSERIVEHSCTKGNSGGVKDCGWKCTVSPSADVEPIESTIRVDETNKGTKIDGASACLRMTRAGHGSNFGRLHVNYRFKLAALEQHLNEDTTRLFNIIGHEG